MSTDYTAYESHFTKELMEICDGQLYAHMFSGCSIEVKDAVAEFMQVKTGKQSMTFKMFDCKLDASRMSGEMDTSLGNGFANLMMFLFACAELGYNPDDVPGMVEGDDGLFRLDGPIPTVKFFKALGMTITVELTKDLNSASFCGQVYDVEEGVVVTDIQEVICRMGWTNKKYVCSKDSVLMELLRARGYSLIYQYGKCPILGVLGLKILELTKDHEIRDSIIDQMDEWERERLRAAMKYVDARGVSVVGVPGPNTRSLVEKLYGISVNEQIEIETKIALMDKIGPLPFQFQNVPAVWENYYRGYSYNSPAFPPVWIKMRDPIPNLLSSGAISPSQATLLSLGVLSS